MSVKDREGVPIYYLVVGGCYKVAARNITYGVWDGNAFHGIRTKFGDTFMDSEIHYDLDEKHGTAVAVERLVMNGRGWR